MTREQIEMASKIAKIVASRRLVTGVDVEDVVQEILLDVWRYRSVIGPMNEPQAAAYIRRVANNVISGLIEKRLAKKRNVIPCELSDHHCTVTGDALANIYAEEFDAMVTNACSDGERRIYKILKENDGQIRGLFTKEQLSSVDGIVYRLRKKVAVLQASGVE